MNLSTRTVAEFIGTFWLVFGGCGSAVLAAAFPSLGIGFVGVALAFGLTVLTMAYAIGHVSGCHLNPAVSLGLVAGGRFPAKEFAPYIVAQVLGACAGAGVLYVIASGRADFNIAGGFASNGYGTHSPGGYSFISCLLAEVVLTAFFLLVIMAFLAWALMSISYIPTLNFFPLSFFWAPFLPLITLFYQGATIFSAIQYYRGQGGQWKNRSQDRRALRSPSGGTSQRITGGNPAQRER